jgi:hypothetical protein
MARIALPLALPLAACDAMLGAQPPGRAERTLLANPPATLPAPQSAAASPPPPCCCCCCMSMLRLFVCCALKLVM